MIIILQTDHLQDELSIQEEFEKVADSRLDTSDHVPAIYKIVTSTLLRHSKRPTSTEVL